MNFNDNPLDSGS